jgi:hypothetical protein
MLATTFELSRSVSMTTVDMRNESARVIDCRHGDVFDE